MDPHPASVKFSLAVVIRPLDINLNRNGTVDVIFKHLSTHFYDLHAAIIMHFNQPSITVCRRSVLQTRLA